MNYKDIFDEFIMMCPWAETYISSWRPGREMEVVVYLKAGGVCVYDAVRRCWRYYDSEAALLKELESGTEDLWRRNFATQLDRKMTMNGYTLDGLSYDTGISRAALSKYIRCESTPSTWNLIKIANALGCTANDLIYFNN